MINSLLNFKTVIALLSWSLQSHYSYFMKHTLFSRNWYIARSIVLNAKYIKINGTFVPWDARDASWDASDSRNFIVGRFTWKERRWVIEKKRVFDRVAWIPFFRAPIYYPLALWCNSTRVALIVELTRARKPTYRKPCLIIYQRWHRGCRSIPSHQFAAVPCSQHRHILIYPNVLHVASQFANRANHPIVLTLPAIQRPRSSFYWLVPATGFTFANTPASKVLNGLVVSGHVVYLYRSIYKSH